MDESPMSDVIGMLDRTTNAVENLLADFDMELLAAPTPCTEWTVSELLDHLVTGARMFASVASGNLPATDAQQSELLSWENDLRVLLSQDLARAGGPKRVTARDMPADHGVQNGG